jgi:aminomethyltransferase
VTDRTSPLDAAHRALGAKMVPFGGWTMPLAYPSGTLAEHRICRTGAVAFDVSHLGTVRVEGKGAFEHLQAVLTNDLHKISPGRAQYTHLLDEDDASVVDDIIVWWLESDRFDVMPNASNTDRVVEALSAPDVKVADVTADRALIAVQGPLARSLLAKVSPAAAAMRRFGVGRFQWQGCSCLAAGTGYTGEDGIECSLPIGSPARTFWEALLDVGVTPAGLGARDTLRLEAALPLHGHELGPGITPLQAGLGWVVAWNKPTFQGRAALVRERDAGVARRLRGVVTAGRQPARQGYPVMAGRAGPRIGEVTSSNFSPVLERGIALTFLPPDLPDDTEVFIDVRGRPLPGRVVPLPFVAKKGA